VLVRVQSRAQKNLVEKNLQGFFMHPYFGTAFEKYQLMKNALFVFAAFILSLSITAQETDTLHIHYFTNGKIATLTTLKNYWGNAYAFNIKGDTIYTRQVRRVGGNAMVHFSHFPSGAVKKARYSSHPDGGIQWYRSETFFDEKGNITDKREDSHERLLSPTHYHINPTHRLETPNPIVPKKEPIKPTHIPETDERVLNPQKPKKEIVVCSSIHNNTTWIINHSSEEIEVHFNTLRESHTYKLKPGEQREGPNYISAEIASPPKQSFPFSFKVLGKRSKTKLKVVCESMKLEEYKTKHTLHFFESTLN